MDSKNKNENTVKVPKRQDQTLNLSPEGNGKLTLTDSETDDAVREQRDRETEN